MDAEPERGVAVLGPVEHDLVGPVEHLGVAVGGRERQQQPVALLASGSPRTRSPRPPAGPSSPARRPAGTPRPRWASARARRPGGCGRRGAGARCQSDAPIADHVVSMPAIISSTIVPPTWSGSSCWPSISASSRKVVRSSRGSARWSSIWAVEVGVELARRSARCAAPAAVSTSSSTMWMNSRKMSASSCGEAEHLDDDPHRDVLGVVDRGVDLGRCPSIASSSSRQSARVNGSSAAMAFGRERGQQQAAGLVVERRVGRDRRRDADRRGQVVRAGRTRSR